MIGTCTTIIYVLSIREKHNTVVFQTEELSHLFFGRGSPTLSLRGKGCSWGRKHHEETRACPFILWLWWKLILQRPIL